MVRKSPAGLLIAALSALAVSAAPVAGAEISDLGAFPNPFSPNGDGVYDSVVVSYVLSDSAWVEVDVEDSLGAVIRNLNAGEWEQEAGDHAYTWHGLNDGSVLQPDGRYTLIVAVDGRASQELTIILDTAPPLVGDLTVSPSRFSPDGDGVADSARVTFTLEASAPTDRYWVTVTDPVGESPLELLTGTGAESVSVYWNGAGAEGAAAPDTVYTVTVSSVDAAGNSDEAATLVDLDVAPPLIWIGDQPGTDVSELRVYAHAETLIVGGAYDRAGVDHVAVSLDGGETWSNAATRPGSREDATVEWSHLFECEACTLGSADDVSEVLVRAHDAVLTSDGLGHYNTSDSEPSQLSFDLVFDVAPPVQDTTYAEVDDATYEAGEEIVIRSEWDAAGYTIAADFSLVDSAVDSAFAMSGVSWSDLGSGIYKIEYTTSVGNTMVPVHDALVRVRATDSYGRAVTDSTVTVTVLEASGGVPGLSVSANAFDPYASESVTITLGSGGDGATVDIYNMAGTLVRTLAAARSDEVSWNGLNDEGDVVASGVYFLHISTYAGDATRKVAVIK